MKVHLQPYTVIDGVPTYTDSFIKWLFKKMQDDGTAKTVYLDGSVKDDDQFLSVMKYSDNALWVVDVDSRIGGIVWLNNFEVKRASFHFCFFKEIWGKKSVEILKQCMLTVLSFKKNGVHDFDLITGIVPARNKKALRVCREAKFNELGILPMGIWNDHEKKSEDGVIFYCQRGIYNG